MRVTLLLAFAAGTLLADDEKPRPINKPPEGFTALFNGKDLTGWQGVVDMRERAKLAATPGAYEKRVKEQNDKVFKHWTIEDGVLYYDGKGNSLQSAKD